MTDKEKVGEIPAWEVVSLTASAYAAAPAPRQLKPNVENVEEAINIEEKEIDASMFMSGHFVFPPSEHENLPLDPEALATSIHEQHKHEHVGFSKDMEEGGKLDKAEEEWDLQFFDEKLNRIEVADEGVSMQGFSLVEKEKILSVAAADFSSLHSDTSTVDSTVCDEKVTPDLNEPSEKGLLLENIPQSPRLKKGDHYIHSYVPFEAWLKKKAACLGAHVKEVNSIWSICIAAAVMGLVILGYRWQRERSRIFHLKCQSSIDSTKANMILGLKDVNRSWIGDGGYTDR